AIYSTYLVTVYQIQHMIFCFFFFFSSRRRHTRWPRDWSSDVCSSDLESARHPLRRRRQGARGAGAARRGAAGSQATEGQRDGGRSEERRVGKECRCRWWPC